jgi:NADH-quinone oxidoreductase subunit N
MLAAAPIDYPASKALADLTQIAPIVALTITLLVAIVLDLLLPRLYRPAVAAVVAASGLALAAAIALVQIGRGGGGPAYSGFATGDQFALFFEVLFAVLGLGTVLIAHPYLVRRGFLAAEFHVLVLASVIGMMVLASATSLVSIFLGLELLSIALYISCGFARGDTASQESAAKYLLVGGFASAFVLYGMALIYGASGTTLVAEIAHRITAESAGDPLLLLGIVLMGVGFAFKVSAAPFHMWTPDVYQGAPVPVTSLMSVGTKAAAFAMIVRVFAGGLPHLAPEWQALLIFVAAASMVVGNFGAIVQSSLKRLLAYSGIAQAGYIMVGVVAGGPAGLAAVLFYLFSYLFMNFGAFALITALARPDGDRDQLSDLDGLGQRRPVVGLLMTVFMLSLAGFPPTVGFIGKFFLFSAAVGAGQTWLVVLAVLMSAVSAYYYLRVVAHVWAPAPGARPAIRFGVGPLSAAVVSGVAALTLGIYPTYLYAAGLVGAAPILISPR